ncbi:MAG: hypothetical protein NTX84_05240 [Nitrospirae bacterium]|nr:hypothetical protein [Nitrospirota bacterium]
MPTCVLLESGPDVYSSRLGRSSADMLTATILDHLEEQTVITLDSLVCLMPEYSWNQIFHRVDALARCKKVVLRRHRFEYTLFSTTFVA